MWYNERMKNENKIKLLEYFEDVETTKSHDGYSYSVGDAITIVIIGCFCGFQNVKQIHEWASHKKIMKVLKNKFGVEDVPSYYWLLCLLKIIDSKSLSEHFTRWVTSLLPPKTEGYTLSFDGKTIRSTDGMKCYENPLHIVSAQIAELGITFGQEAVESKSNEIPAVQRLIKILDIKGFMVVADAMNCQKNTAAAVIEKEADYLLCVKDNHPTMKEEIEDYVQNKSLRDKMDTAETNEKSRNRIEKRTAYTTFDVDWFEDKNEWKNLACFGAVNTSFATKDGVSDEWHYYISSKKLTAEELLKHARAEWSVETMHWLLDVRFGEDFCRIQDDNIQTNLNIIRKIVINSIRIYKTKTKSKRAFSNLMLDCLIDPAFIFRILKFQN
jgi:predicted transposase YbfD/YdcC